MSDKKVNSLIHKHPKFFEMFNKWDGSRPYPPMAFGVLCSDGWYELLDKLMSDIDTYCTKHPEVSYPQVSQIKEKFGGLRFYITGGDGYISDLISEAENKSYSICEECGTTEGVFQTRGWIRTTCPDCNEKRKIKQV